MHSHTHIARWQRWTLMASNKGLLTMRKNFKGKPRQNGRRDDDSWVPGRAEPRLGLTFGASPNEYLARRANLQGSVVLDIKINWPIKGNWMAGKQNKVFLNKKTIIINLIERRRRQGRQGDGEDAKRVGQDDDQDQEREEAARRGGKGLSPRHPFASHPDQTRPLI